MDDPIQALTDLLAAERQAILVGDFSAIDQLYEEKEQLAQLVGQASVDVNLAPLRSAIAHNQMLLQAAIDGVASARKRIDEVTQVQAKLKVYTPWGLQTIQDRTGVELSKKA